MQFKRKIFIFTIETIIFVCFIAVLLNYSSLLSDPSKLYSTSIAPRLQTNAFLNGHLSLSSQPFGYKQDFVWNGHGLQQNWGLGVPLLRFPFEWASNQLGLRDFPDRLILLFYLIFTIVLLNITLNKVIMVLGIHSLSWVRLLIRWYLIAWIFLSPAIGCLIQENINVYNETVLYGCLYTYLLLCLFLKYIIDSNSKNFIFLCLLSGLAWLIRPTLIFYGLFTLLFASLFSYQNKREIRLVIIGLVCFCIGVAIEVWGNYLRFGSILSVKYPLTGNPIVNYITRFDSPFNVEHIWSAAKELFGELFFNNPWPSHMVRWRWGGGYYPFPFNFTHLLVLILGFFMYISFLSFKFFKRVNSPLIYFSLAWGFSSFIFLFGFYLRFPAIASRYLSEFSPAINIIFIILFLIIIHSLKSYNKINQTFVLSFVFLLGLFYYSNERFFEFNIHALKISPQIQVTDKKGIQKYIANFNHDINLRPYLPETSYCSQSYTAAGLIYQYAGWDLHHDCLVSAVTSVILPFKKCITLNYTIQSNRQMPKVQVKRNDTFLKLVDSQMSVENISHLSPLRITQFFCSDSPITSSLAQYSIGWVSSIRFNAVREKKLLVQLNWISVAEQSLKKVNK